MNEASNAGDGFPDADVKIEDRVKEKAAPFLGFISESFGPAGDFQDEIECLGIEASPSFVREPEGNGVAERFIRTLKENLLWVRTFDTIEELRAALIEFARHYNETWLVARHGYRTPAQVRADQSRVDQTATADLSLAA